MKLERSHVALQIFLELLAKEKIYGSFLHDEMEKINGMLDLSYKTADAFMKKGENTDR